MNDEGTAHGVGSAPGGAASPDRQLPDIELTSVASGVGERLAKSLGSRRLLIRGAVAVSSAAVTQHYVKPSLQSLGVPAALAISGSDDKKDKKDK
jgi:hypothetical protein